MERHTGTGLTRINGQMVEGRVEKIEVDGILK